LGFGGTIEGWFDPTPETTEDRAIRIEFSQFATDGRYSPPRRDPRRRCAKIRSESLGITGRANREWRISTHGGLRIECSELVLL
jgi:hypothetical protein